MSILCRKSITRRSFFIRLAGFFALFFVSPMKAIAPEPVLSLSEGLAVGFPVGSTAMGGYYLISESEARRLMAFVPSFNPTQWAQVASEYEECRLLKIGPWNEKV